MWIAITLLMAVGLLSSCKLVHQVLPDSKFDASLAESELARERSGNTYPFTLNCEYVTADVIQKKNPKKLPFVHTFDDIEVCGQRKDGIKGVYSNCWFSTYSVAAQVYLSRVNGIG